MNNKEFIEILAGEIDHTVADTSKFVAAIVEVMSEELQTGNAVQVQEFGTFEVKKKMERISVIPTTGQRILVPPKLVLSFRPASALKELLK
ncbi:MAG: HU family DNA-binding protein [Bacteroidaceae bacterium]|nr:HU family DNA-binding protein [Bacteroidaceae bacterium]